MGKKDIREKKNKEVQARLVREAKIMGIKEDDPVLKQALEDVANVKGASKGRNKILTEQLVTLNKYVKAKAKAEKTIEKQAQVVENVTSQHYTREDMEKFMEDRLNQMLEEKLSDFLKNIEENYAKIIEEKDKEVKRITFTEIADKVQNKAKQIKSNVVNGVVLGGTTIYEGGKNVLNKTKEVAGNVKDATVETYEKAKETVYEKVEDAKDMVYNAYDKTKEVAYTAKSYGNKFKNNAARQKDKQINNLMNFFERTKSKTKELKDKVVGKVNSFKSSFTAAKDEFIQEYNTRKDYTGAIYRNKLLNKALSSAASFRIDLDSPEAENLKEAIYNRINYVLDTQDFYGVEDIDGAVLAQAEEIYRAYNIEIMNKQREISQKNIEPHQVNNEEVKYDIENTSSSSDSNMASDSNSDSNTNPKNNTVAQEINSSFMIGTMEAGCLFETSSSGVKTARSLINGKLGVIREISEEEYKEAMGKYAQYTNELEHTKQKEHANEMEIA